MPTAGGGSFEAIQDAIVLAPYEGTVCAVAVTDVPQTIDLRQAVTPQAGPDVANAGADFFARRYLVLDNEGELDEDGLPTGKGDVYFFLTDDATADIDPTTTGTVFDDEVPARIAAGTKEQYYFGPASQTGFYLRLVCRAGQTATLRIAPSSITLPQRI